MNKSSFSKHNFVRKLSDCELMAGAKNKNKNNSESDKHRRLISNGKRWMMQTFKNDRIASAKYYPFSVVLDCFPLHRLFYEVNISCLTLSSSSLPQSPTFPIIRHFLLRVFHH